MPTRRRFLHAAAGLSALSWLDSTSSAWGARAPGVQPSALITGKSDELQVLTADPLVFESSLSSLDRHRVTPKELLFVRNNANPEGMATVAAPQMAHWKVELTGLKTGASRIELSALREHALTEVEMVLQCSGNGRSMFSRAAKTEGTQWGRGGIGNVVFGGVPLARVLEQWGLEPSEPARYVALEGYDAPAAGKANFEHSVPLEDAVERGMLALAMNGEPIPAVHGGPVRFVLPGYYGTVQIKWLSRMRFEPEESANEHHAKRYRTPHRLLKPGEEYHFDRANSTPTWKQKIAALTTSHVDGQPVAAGERVIAGYAWNDGAAPLTQVLFSTDRGANWRRAELDLAKSPYAWSRWRARTTIAPGRNEVWIAATDGLGRTQPLDGAIFWNPHGYEWNGVDRLTLTGMA